MNRIVMISMAALSLAACKSPCEQAEKAFTDCVEAAGVEVQTEEGTCEDDKGENDELYDCVADAFNDADCSTEEGFGEAFAASLECSGVELPDTGSL